MFKHIISKDYSVNSAGLLLPKEWMGKEVNVILIDRSLEIKKEVINILEPYFENIIGIYLVGSYARGEQTENSDIDIIAISENIKKEITSGRYNISVYPIESVKKSIKNNPILIYPRLIEAKPLLNNLLLKELLSSKINRNSFKNFIKESSRIISINKKILLLDKLGKNNKSEKREFASSSVIYSIILRLKGIYLIEGILNKKAYSNKLFKTWIMKNIDIKNEKIEEIYEVYQLFKDNKRIKIRISVNNAEEILKFLEKEVKKYGK